MSESNIIEFHGFKGTTSRRVLPQADPNSTFEEIPQVDCSRLYSSSLQERTDIAEAVGKAFREVGFLYAISHGIPVELQDEIYRASKEFFDLPLAEKMKVHNSMSKAKRGYQFLSEGRDDDPLRNGMFTCILHDTATRSVKRALISTLY
jgi:isopenicillin N synthase-like dioxygenase